MLNTVYIPRLGETSQQIRGGLQWARRGAALAGASFGFLGAMPGATAAPAAPADPIVKQFALSLARDNAGLPGGMTILSPTDLPGKSLRFSKYNTDFAGDTYKEWFDQLTSSAYSKDRVLVFSTHSGYGLGVATAADGPRLQKDPANSGTWVRRTARGAKPKHREIISVSRFLNDLPPNYSLAVLAQCNPRALLGNNSITVSDAITASRVAGFGKGTTVTVHNLDNTIYLKDGRLLRKAAHTPRLRTTPIAKVISPDAIGLVLSTAQPERSTGIDAFVMSGGYTTKPSKLSSEMDILPTGKQVSKAGLVFSWAEDVVQQEQAAGEQLAAKALANAERKAINRAAVIPFKIPALPIKGAAGVVGLAGAAALTGSAIRRRRRGAPDITRPIAAGAPPPVPTLSGGVPSILLQGGVVPITDPFPQGLPVEVPEVRPNLPLPKPSPVASTHHARPLGYVPFPRGRSVRSPQVTATRRRTVRVQRRVAAPGQHMATPAVFPHPEWNSSPRAQSVPFRALDPQAAGPPQAFLDQVLADARTPIPASSQLPKSGRPLGIVNVSKLPTLQTGWVRGVHLAPQDLVGTILENGLDYSGQGMLSSTARFWEDAAAVEFSSLDPRFRGLPAVVFDMPGLEARLHNDMVRSPGVVPAARIIGVVPHGTGELIPRSGGSGGQPIGVVPVNAAGNVTSPPAAVGGPNPQHVVGADPPRSQPQPSPARPGGPYASKSPAAPPPIPTAASPATAAPPPPAAPPAAPPASAPGGGTPGAGTAPPSPAARPGSSAPTRGSGRLGAVVGIGALLLGGGFAVNHLIQSGRERRQSRRDQVDTGISSLFRPAGGYDASQASRQLAYSGELYPHHVNLESKTGRKLKEQFSLPYQQHSRVDVLKAATQAEGLYPSVLEVVRSIAPGTPLRGGARENFYSPGHLGQLRQVGAGWIASRSIHLQSKTASRQPWDLVVAAHEASHAARYAAGEGLSVYQPDHTVRVRDLTELANEEFQTNLLAKRHLKSILSPADHKKASEFLDIAQYTYNHTANPQDPAKALLNLREFYEHPARWQYKVTGVGPTITVPPTQSAVLPLLGRNWDMVARNYEQGNFDFSASKSFASKTEGRLWRKNQLQNLLKDGISPGSKYRNTKLFENPDGTYSFYHYTRSTTLQYNPKAAPVSEAGLPKSLKDGLQQIHVNLESKIGKFLKGLMRLPFKRHSRADPAAAAEQAQGLLNPGHWKDAFTQFKATGKLSPPIFLAAGVGIGALLSGIHAVDQMSRQPKLRTQHANPIDAQLTDQLDHELAATQEHRATEASDNLHGTSRVVLEDAQLNRREIERAFDNHALRGYAYS